MISEICALLALVVAAVGAHAQAPPQQCPIRASPSVDLTLADGRTVYVEAHSFASQGGWAFLAGRPNFIMRGTHLEATDSIFGVTFTSPESVQMVPLPPHVSNASNPRVLPLGDGHWAAVFAEVAPGGRIPSYSHVLRLWYGVFDGVAWSQMEQIPIPAKGWLRAYATSALIANGDTLTVAMPLDSVSATNPVETHVAVFTRNGGRWSISEIPTYTVGYLSLVSLGADGMRIAVVQADTSRRPSDSGSLFVYGPDPNWPSGGVLVQGRDTPVHFPLLRDDGDKFYLSWMEIPHTGFSWIAHSYSGSNADLLSRPVARMDSAAVTEMDPNAVLLMQTTADGIPTRWLVTDHAESSERGAPHELRLYDDSTGNPRLVSSVPNEYTGEVGESVLLRSSGRILVVGPHFYGSFNKGGSVTTGVVQFALSCRDR